MKDPLPPLPWKTMLQICIGVARGLEFLHTGKPLIIRRDIKSSNILLNQNWIAKISDFELSILVPTSLLDSDDDIVDISANVAGTMGYMDPEYMYGRLTLKSDIYIFGVVLFEVLSGRNHVHFDIDGIRSPMSLSQSARGCVADGRLDEIIDPRLRGEIAPNCLKAYGDLAYNGTNLRGNERPPIAAVVKRLELALLLQECIEAHIPFSPSWLKSIVPPRGMSEPLVKIHGSEIYEYDSSSIVPSPTMSEPVVEIQDSGIYEYDYYIDDLEDLLRD